MSASVSYEGFEELRDFLRGLPDVVKDRIGGFVRDATDDTEAQLLAVYPDGEMKARVFSRFVSTSGPVGIQGEVISPTDQAHWWEFGTVVRQTQQGWNRGSEPAHPDRGLVGIAIKNRRIMERRTLAVLEELGFTVEGTP